jgi:hypothetical protein
MQVSCQWFRFSRKMAWRHLNHAKVGKVMRFTNRQFGFMETTRRAFALWQSPSNMG